MDLGATPLSAFFKVVFPDLAPGITFWIFTGIYDVFRRFYHHLLHQRRRHQYAVNINIQ